VAAAIAPLRLNPGPSVSLVLSQARAGAAVTAPTPKTIAFGIAFRPQFIDSARALLPRSAIPVAGFVGLAAGNALAARRRAAITRLAVPSWLARAGGLGGLTATGRRTA
jgi:threonine/homoserine/homoserine lactone efflux protein